MKRMIKELKFYYWNPTTLKVFCLKLLFVYAVLGLMSLFLAFTDRSFLKPIDMLIYAIFLTIGIILFLPLVWFLDLKPISDQIYEEERLKRNHPFISKRFNNRQ
jgi:hypothetical protein